MGKNSAVAIQHNNQLKRLNYLLCLNVEIIFRFLPASTAARGYQPKRFKILYRKSISVGFMFKLRFYLHYQPGNFVSAKIEKCTT